MIDTHEQKYCKKISLNIDIELLYLIDTMTNEDNFTRTQRIETILYQWFFDEQNIKLSTKLIKEFRKKHKIVGVKHEDTIKN